MNFFKKNISEKEVINFLLENPDFFLKNPNALEKLEIRHESGEAVSLIEKQVEIIKKKNILTSSRLSEFLTNAEYNQQLFIKVKKLVMLILEENNLEELSILTESFFEKELGTEICRVYFFTQDELFDLSSKRIITPEIATSIFAEVFKSNNISLGGINQELAGMVFGSKASIEEGAICKLNCEKIAGTLALGSSSKGKFSKDSETLFLEFILSVFSNRVDSILNNIDA